MFFVFLKTNLVGYDRLHLFLFFGGFANVILHDCILLENKPFHPFSITTRESRRGAVAFSSCGTFWKSQQLITGLT